MNLSVIGENQTLQVSWHVHPQFSESVLEYVVQYVSVVPYHPCLNWVRANRTQRSVTITGGFVSMCTGLAIFVRAKKSKKFKSSVLHEFGQCSVLTNIVKHTCACAYVLVIV